MAKGDTAAVDSDDVRAKRAEAEEWAIAVRAARQFGEWRHLFVTESGFKAAPSWEALVAIANG